MDELQQNGAMSSSEDPKAIINPALTVGSSTILVTPERGAHMVYPRPGDTLKCFFDANTAQISIQEGDVVINFPNGARYTIVAAALMGSDGKSEPPKFIIAGKTLTPLELAGRGQLIDSPDRVMVVVRPPISAESVIHDRGERIASAEEPLEGERYDGAPSTGSTMYNAPEHPEQEIRTARRTTLGFKSNMSGNTDKMYVSDIVNTGTEEQSGQGPLFLVTGYVFSVQMFYGGQTTVFGSGAGAIFIDVLQGGGFNVDPRTQLQQIQVLGDPVNGDYANLPNNIMVRGVTPESDGKVYIYRQMSINPQEVSSTPVVIKINGMPSDVILSSADPNVPITKDGVTWVIENIGQYNRIPFLLKYPESMPTGEFDITVQIEAKIPGFSKRYVGTNTYKVSFKPVLSENDLPQAANELVFATNGQGLFTVLGSGNDVVYGTNAPNTIYSGAGNDVVYGGNSNDAIYLGSGADIVYYSEGSDYINGGPIETGITGREIVNQYDITQYARTYNIGGRFSSDLGAVYFQKPNGAVDTIVNVQYFKGTDYHDTFTINASQHIVFDGGNGADTVYVTTGGIITLYNAGRPDFEMEFGTLVFFSIQTNNSQQTMFLTNIGTLMLSAQNDAIYGGYGNNLTIDAGGGVNFVSYEALQASGITVNYLATNNSYEISGASFSSPTGTEYYRNIDVIYGSQQADRFNLIERGAITIDLRFGGSNTVSYAQSTSGLIFEFNANNTIYIDKPDGARDVILNRSDSDAIVATDFDDVFRVRGVGIGVDGGGGTNTLDYATSGSGVSVDLASGQVMRLGGTDIILNNSFQIFIGDSINANSFFSIFGTTAAPANFSFTGGSSGQDLLSYEKVIDPLNTSSILVDLDAGTVIKRINNVNAGVDTFYSIQSFIGTTGDDIFIAQRNNPTQRITINGRAGTNFISFANLTQPLITDGTTIPGAYTLINIQGIQGTIYDDVFYSVDNNTTQFDGLYSSNHNTNVYAESGTGNTISLAALSSGATVYMRSTGLTTGITPPGPTDTLDKFDGNYVATIQKQAGTQRFSSMDNIILTLQADTFYNAFDSALNINGNGGYNTLTMQHISSIYGTMVSSSVDFTNGTMTKRHSNGTTYTDYFENFQLVIGTAGDDTFYLNPNANYLTTIDGNGGQNNTVSFIHFGSPNRTFEISLNGDIQTTQYVLLNIQNIQLTAYSDTAYISSARGYTIDFIRSNSGRNEANYLLHSLTTPFIINATIGNAFNGETSATVQKIAGANSTIDILRGFNTLIGTSGNDTFIFTGTPHNVAGGYTLIGGGSDQATGGDTLDFRVNSGITVDYGAGQAVSASGLIVNFQGITTFTFSNTVDDTFYAAQTVSPDVTNININFGTSINDVLSFANFVSGIDLDFNGDFVIGQVTYAVTGANTVYLTNFDDTLITFAGSQGGNRTYYMGRGFDSVSYDFQTNIPTTGITAYITNNGSSAIDSENYDATIYRSWDGGSTDTIISVNRITGTAVNDTFYVASNVSMVLDGNGGTHNTLYMRNFAAGSVLDATQPELRLVKGNDYIDRINNIQVFVATAFADTILLAGVIDGLYYDGGSAATTPTGVLDTVNMINAPINPLTTITYTINPIAINQWNTISDGTNTMFVRNIERYTGSNNNDSFIVSSNNTQYLLLDGGAQGDNTLTYVSTGNQGVTVDTTTSRIYKINNPSYPQVAYDTYSHIQTIYLGNGNDTILATNTIPANLVVYGGGGINSLSYENSLRSITHIQTGGITGNGQFFDITAIIGSNFNDSFYATMGIGSRVPFIIDGGLGFDTIYYVDYVGAVGGYDNTYSIVFNLDSANAQGYFDINVQQGATTLETDSIRNITQVSGSQGNDVFIMGSRGFVINGVVGNNTVDYSSANYSPNIGLFVNLSNNTVYQGTNYAITVSKAGANGGGGVDYINNVSTIIGTNANDTFLVGDLFTDAITIDGNGGVNTASFATSAERKSFDWSTGVMVVSNIGGGVVANITLTNIQIYHGTNNGDVFLGGGFQTNIIIVGGTGHNTLSYINVNTNITFLLSANRVIQTNTPAGFSDTYSNISEISGSTGNTVFTNGVATDTYTIYGSGGTANTWTGTNTVNYNSTGIGLFIYYDSAVRMFTIYKGLDTNGDGIVDENDINVRIDRLWEINHLTAGNGNDTFITSAQAMIDSGSNIPVDGGAGQNTMRIRNGTANGMLYNMNTGAFTWNAQTATNVDITGFQTLYLEQAIGSNFNTIIYGTNFSTDIRKLDGGYKTINNNLNQLSVLDFSEFIPAGQGVGIIATISFDNLGQGITPNGTFQLPTGEIIIYENLNITNLSNRDDFITFGNVFNIPGVNSTPVGYDGLGGSNTASFKGQATYTSTQAFIIENVGNGVNSPIDVSITNNGVQTGTIIRLTNFQTLIAPEHRTTFQITSANFSANFSGGHSYNSGNAFTEFGGTAGNIYVTTVSYLNYTGQPLTMLIGLDWSGSMQVNKGLATDNFTFISDIVTSQNVATTIFQYGSTTYRTITSSNAGDSIIGMGDTIVYKNNDSTTFILESTNDGTIDVVRDGQEHVVGFSTLYAGNGDTTFIINDATTPQAMELYAGQGNNTLQVAQGMHYITLSSDGINAGGIVFHDITTLQSESIGMANYTVNWQEKEIHISNIGEITTTLDFTNSTRDIIVIDDTQGSILNTMDGTITIGNSLFMVSGIQHYVLSSGDDVAILGGGTSDVVFGGGGHNTARYDNVNEAVVVTQKNDGSLLINNTTNTGQDWLEGFQEIILADKDNIINLNGDLLDSKALHIDAGAGNDTAIITGNISGASLARSLSNVENLDVSRAANETLAITTDQLQSIMGEDSHLTLTMAQWQNLNLLNVNGDTYTVHESDDGSLTYLIQDGQTNQEYQITVLGGTSGHSRH